MAHRKENTRVNHNMSLNQTKSITNRQESNLRARAAQEAGRVMNRMLKQANGELTRNKLDEDGKIIRDEEGHAVQEYYDMSNAEMRAAEVVLNKTVPNLQAVQHVEGDPTDNLSREEMSQMLVGILAGNPQLAQMSGLSTAVDKVNTVATVEPLVATVHPAVAEVVPIEIKDED